jgi:flagellar basal body-associated protein FliL
MKATLIALFFIALVALCGYVWWTTSGISTTNSNNLAQGSLQTVPTSTSQTTTAQPAKQEVIGKSVEGTRYCCVPFWRRTKGNSFCCRYARRL